MTWYRSPVTAPSVPLTRADPNRVSNNEYTDVLLTAYVTDPDNNVMSVVIDLSSIGESESQTMYDDGSHGDVTAGDGTYSFLVNEI